MPRPTLAELEHRCQKPDYRASGNWMARRVSRPAALRITWVVAPCGVSAHAATVIATLVAIGAACFFGVGTPGTCLIGAALLQLWYLLDHVDGQLARLHGASSLDGIQLDYLMHHVVNVAVPIGLGYGVARQDGEPWLLLGMGFAIGLLLLGLAHDTRYKAFIARLKKLETPLIVVRQVHREPGNIFAFREKVSAVWLRRSVHFARKVCEIHVVMNFLTAIAIMQYLGGDMLVAKVYLAIMSPLALLTATATLARDIRRQAAEQEFATWFTAPHEETARVSDSTTR